MRRSQVSTFKVSVNWREYQFDIVVGLEGALGVTAMAVSNVTKRFLAVCEEAKQAICIIYDL